MECFKYLEIVTVFGSCIFQLIINININLCKFLKLVKAKITIQEGDYTYFAQLITNLYDVESLL